MQGSAGAKTVCGDDEGDWARRRIEELETQLAQTLSLQNKEVWSGGEPGISIVLPLTVLLATKS